jgi:hypothetical protein
LTSTTAPEGKTLAYTYDTRSNVLTVTSTPKPGSPLAPLVTTYSYDPIYNKPTQIVDPLGLVTSMSYDGATGNLTTSISDVGSSPHFNALLPRGLAGGASRLWSPDQSAIMRLHRLVALASRLSQAFDVRNLDISPRIPDQARLLQGECDGSDAGPSDTQHLGQKLLRERQTVTA